MAPIFPAKQMHELLPAQLALHPATGQQDNERRVTAYHVGCRMQASFDASRWPMDDRYLLLDVFARRATARVEFGLALISQRLRLNVCGHLLGLRPGRVGHFLESPGVLGKLLPGFLVSFACFDRIELPDDFRVIADTSAPVYF